MKFRDTVAFDVVKYLSSKLSTEGILSYFL